MCIRDSTATDLISAFNREHVQLPGGFLVSVQAEQLLKLDLEFHKTKELADLIISTKAGASIRLKDIATIEDGITDNRQVARYNGKPTVGIGMVKIANANTVEIISEVERRLEKDCLLYTSHANQLLQEEENTSAPVTRVLQIIEDNIGRIDKIIKDVLELNRRDRTHQEQIELSVFLLSLIHI